MYSTSHPIRPGRDDWAKWIIIFAIVVGSAIRLWGLGLQSFWIDELFTMESLYAKSFSFYMDRWVLPDPHTPLYPVLLFYWTKFFGMGEIVSRLPSAIFGVLALIASWRMGRTVLKEPQLLAIFVVLNAFSTTAITYSQDARPYSLLYLFSLCTTLTCLRLLMEIKARTAVRNWTLINHVLFSLGCAFTHYFGMAYVYAQFLLLVIVAWQKKWMVRQIVLAWGVVAIITLSWLVYHYGHMINMRLGKTWITYTDVNLLFNFAAHVFGRPSLEMTVIRHNGGFQLLLARILIATGPFLLIVIPFLMRPLASVKGYLNAILRGDGVLQGAVFLALFPLMAFFVLGHFVRIVWVHYLLFLLPPFYVCIAFWVWTGLQGFKKPGLYAMSAGLIVLLLWSPFFYRPYRQDVRGIVEYAASYAQAHPETVVAYQDVFYSYYFKNNQYFIDNPSMTIKEFVDSGHKPKRVMLLALQSHLDIDGKDLDQRVTKEVDRRYELETMHRMCKVFAKTYVLGDSGG